MTPSLRAAVIAEWRGLPAKKTRPDRWQVPGDLLPKLMQQAGTNPTRQSVVNALKTANLAGPGLVPISYTSTSGYTGAQMGTISGGKLTLSGPRYTATDNGPIGTFNGTQPPPPSNL